ncbi:UDP-N-acetylmuramoyl-L-alanyl-D-glutamate--L-lysine ligase [Lactococcus termiticola]|uniref:UDP-N-acetylmuramyl-tripeptide synthetase n=1 Tax=Lactococcus termiticola TaxID=2169526 RepID=A0A2R5HGZ1_9LACT|nr:UDP-N-acetylmuramoyl-L-alanyl-D-glutamate--L-lysine ligase [Lactococcus termiticola]GBG97309.1 UDP-N-acetylmuramoyl-L-alanyl-D-glutamate--L-lysine ligase [Lactococcus termiticola]
MISIERVLEILIQDDNFREIVGADDQLFYSWPEAIHFEQLSYDSRKTDDKTLFFAKGLNFKKEFLTGLSVPFYLSEVDYAVDIPAILVNDVKQAMSLIAQEFYGRPQDKLKILALTGTKGKTTSAYFAKSILDEMNGGKTALLSTAQTTLDGKTYVKSELTTPESLDLLEMMATALKKGMTHLVMEVSSQAYKTKRVYGLSFDVGVFLNISPDHIGPIEHPTFEDYFYCKRQLIKHSHYFVANSEMQGFEVVKQEIEARQIPHAFYGEKSDNQIINSSALDFKLSGLVSGDFSIRLLGRFNQENALATALATKALGANDEQIHSGLAKALVPGRMETLTASSGAKLYIDYAHNGVSLENLVEVVESHHSGRLVLILGSTGNKGESRRKDFAQVIESHPRLEVVLTQDDSNYEDPKAIADEIASQISRPVAYEGNRELAIRDAIALVSGADDAVIIAGKGEDKFQLVNGVREPYLGDVAAAEKYL